MSKGFFIGIIFFVVVLCWINYEVYSAPLMPDDYDLREEDILQYLINKPTLLSGFIYFGGPLGPKFELFQ